METQAADVYASLWEDSGTRLWTAVNRTGQAVDGVVLHVPAVASQRYFDLMGGGESTPETHNGYVPPSGTIAAHGIGAYLAIGGHAVDDALMAFVAAQAQLHARSSDDATFPARSITLRPVAPTSPLARSDVPNDMVIVEGTTTDLEITFRTRECGMYDGAPFVNVWRPWHPELHGVGTQKRTAPLLTYAIARNEVTNAEFAHFLQASNYQPHHCEQFLQHWRDGKHHSAQTMIRWSTSTSMMRVHIVVGQKRACPRKMNGSTRQKRMVRGTGSGACGIGPKVSAPTDAPAFAFSKVGETVDKRTPVHHHLWYQRSQRCNSYVSSCARR